LTEGQSRDGESKGRKFRMSLILANQFISQIPEHIQKAISGNVGTIVSFRTGIEDAEILEKRFYPYITKMDIINLQNWNAYISTLNNGKPVPPFSLQTDYEYFEEDINKIEEICTLSRSRYANKKNVIL